MAAAAGRKAGGERHRGGHHLSGKGGGDHVGWADGISALTEEHSATRLLDELPTRTASAGIKVRRLLDAGGMVSTTGRAAAGHGAHPCATLVPPPASCLQAAAALPAWLDRAEAGAGTAPAPEEERRARVEHALRSLEVEVLQRGELLADLGAPDGYGPTGLTQAELEELLAQVEAHMAAACAADVTVLRRRTVRGRPGAAAGVERGRMPCRPVLAAAPCCAAPGGP